MFAAAVSSDILGKHVVPKSGAKYLGYSLNCISFFDRAHEFSKRVASYLLHDVLSIVGVDVRMASQSL